MPLRQIDKLDESYRRESGVVFITGLQALVRLLIEQHRRDLAAGLNTAGFVSGYRGSPLGGLDRELWRARQFLEPANIKFEPGLNEDLAATSIWGSQQANLFPGAKYDGVYALWYGKGPGVDRSGDAFKHGNSAGTTRYGGVLVAAGDDHTCKSSSLPSQSEYNFVDAMMPVINPADVQEMITLGLYGFAMSRFSGCWVGFKIVQETADATQTVNLTGHALDIVLPEFDMPPGGLNIRWPDPPNDQEYRLQRYKLQAARAFVRANGLDRVVIDSPSPRLGIVTTGKAHLDTLQALEDLGIDARRAAEIGISLYKVGVNWPLEPHGIREFAEGLEEIVVVEEKRALVESQIKEQLYNWRASKRPLVVGKYDEQGAWLLPSTGELTPAHIARALAGRIAQFHESSDLNQRVRAVDEQDRESAAIATKVQRLPHFCSGCPHNTSTRVPEGSRAVGGIGCHFMAGWMDRHTETYTQMGGEGAAWIGQAPFTETRHIFQNIGDGTYAHSGLLAIRAAVAAGVNITYKILFNDAVAMTGGQAVEGHLTVQRVVGQLIAEGVDPIVVLSDHPEKYASRKGLPDEVAVRDRRALDVVQRELREKPGVSALIYDQTCAAELHRKRKRGLIPTPNRRVVINELVCEGCGDCNIQSNCLSVMAHDTEFGRKRRINQSSCNQDYSCLTGFCPSFVTITGATRNPPKPLASETLPSLPSPVPTPLGGVYNVLIAGVGGTGVVTASGLLGLAAHLEGKAVAQLDQTGLAQKFGAVLSHVRIAEHQHAMHGMRIPNGQVDLLIGADLMVAAGTQPLSMLSNSRSVVVVNTHEEMPSQFIRERDFAFPSQSMLDALRRRSRPGKLSTLDATHLASALLGDSIAANIFMLGFSFQRGLLPVSGEALYRALELYGVNVNENKTAFDWGRFTAHNPDEVALMAAGDEPGKPQPTLDEAVERRANFLVDYQDEAYAERYRSRMLRIRECENKAVPGSRRLSETVAKNYFKLLAYKDEYEVARLYVKTDFLTNLKENFRGKLKISFHMSPPLLARMDPNSGRPKKYELGQWMLPVLRLLARAKRLRGTRFDLFGYSSERRTERQLIEEYEAVLNRIERELEPSGLDLAVEIANLPDAIRGFGPIKAAAVERARQKRDSLLRDWEARPSSVAETSLKRSSAA